MSTLRRRSSHAIVSFVDDVGESIEVRRRPIGTAHAQRDPRQRAGSDERLEIAVRAAVRRGHRLGDELGEPGREAGSREVHEHRRPGADRLGDVEDAHELALLQPDDVDDEVRQPIRIELEHEVARQRLERVSDRTPGVGLGAGVDESEHGPRPISDRRDRQDALAVGARRQQTDEAMLHGTVAHAHACPPRTAVDRRNGLAPRDDDRTVRCVGLGRRWIDLVIGAELTELGAVANDEPVVDAVVHRGAEEHEVLGRQPVQDRVVLAERRHPVAHLGESRRRRGGRRRPPRAHRLRAAAAASASQ